MSWLYNRLTPSKRKTTRWAEFAATVEAVWEEYFDPELSRLIRLRSVYEMDEADLNKKMREMGDSFTCDTPLAINKPLSLAWRRLELQSKDTEDIISSIFLRNFAHLPVTWFPLFAPIGEEYGTYFEAYGGLSDDDNKNVPPEGMWLTSRGVLGTDKLAMYEAGMFKADFRTQAIPLVARAKPLHIVFDGFLWYISFDLPFSAEASAEWDSESQYTLLFTTVGSRFDIPGMSADGEIPLDTSTMTFSSEGVRQIAIPFVNEGAWQSDSIFLHDGLGFGDFGLDGFLPLDLNIAPFVSEARRHGRLPLLVLKDVGRSHSMWASTCQMAQDLREQEHLSVLNVESDFSFDREHQETFSLPFLDSSASVPLDSHFGDGFPSHWLPLDLTVPNSREGDFVPLYVAYTESAHSYTLCASVGASERGEKERTLAMSGSASFARTGACDTEYSLQFLNPQHSVPLDSYMGDGFPSHWLPLDLAVPSSPEGYFVPFYTAFAEGAHSYALGSHFYMQTGKRDICKAFSSILASSVTVSSSAVFSRQWGLNMSQASTPSSAQPLLFDQIPADFMPLDTYGGINV